MKGLKNNISIVVVLSVLSILKVNIKIFLTTYFWFSNPFVWNCRYAILVLNAEYLEFNLCVYGWFAYCQMYKAVFTKQTAINWKDLRLWNRWLLTACFSRFMWQLKRLYTESRHLQKLCFVEDFCNSVHSFTKEFWSLWIEREWDCGLETTENVDLLLP